MKITRFIALIITGAIIMMSCQKEITEENIEPVDPPATTDSTYIDQLIEFDSISPTQVDTLYITRYQYDASKRVISQKQYWDDGGGIALMDEYNYTYTGTDTVPSKCTNYSYDFAGGGYLKDTTITFYTYAAGRRVKDSAVYYNTFGSGPVNAYSDTTVTLYNYTASQITTEVLVKGGDRLDPGSGGESRSRDTATLDARGNVISSTTYDSYDGGLTWDFFFASQFTYDTKPSPFSKLSNFKTLYLVAPPESEYYEMQSPNNRISHLYDYGSGSTEDGTYTGFIYKPNGLVSSFRYTEGTASGDLVVKFFYKAL